MDTDGKARCGVHNDAARKARADKYAAKAAIEKAREEGRREARRRKMIELVYGVLGGVGSVDELTAARIVDTLIAAHFTY